MTEQDLQHMEHEIHHEVSLTVNRYLFLRLDEKVSHDDALTTIAAEILADVRTREIMGEAA